MSAALAFAVRRYGLIVVLRRCANKVIRWSTARQRGGQATSDFDRAFGTDTDRIVPLWKLQIASPYRSHGVRYEPSDPAFVRSAIEHIPIRPEDFVFIDIGSGKGRTLLVASGSPFRRVLGIEFSPELSVVATENLAKYKPSNRRCEEVRSLCVDAINYAFPLDNVLLFLYNPFGEEVFRQVLDNLRRSLIRQEREVYVIYSNPVCERLLDESDFLQRLESPIDAAVYKNVLGSGSLTLAPKKR